MFHAEKAVCKHKSGEKFSCNRRKEIPFRKKRQCKRSNLDKITNRLILISVECNRLSSQHHRGKFQGIMSSFWCILSDLSLIYVMCKVHITRSYHSLLLGIDSPSLVVREIYLCLFFPDFISMYISRSYYVSLQCLSYVLEKKISLYVIIMNWKASQVAQTGSQHIK